MKEKRVRKTSRLQLKRSARGKLPVAEIFRLAVNRSGAMGPWEGTRWVRGVSGKGVCNKQGRRVGFARREATGAGIRGVGV